MKLFIYIDMNAFFASCHQVEDPTLKNKPLIVCGNSRRAIVSSASYEARKFGIKSAMPVYKAKEACPFLKTITLNHKLYQKYSHKIFDFLKNNFTNLITCHSIDEFCLDMTDCYQTYGNPYNCARMIQLMIKETFALSCNIGISYNQILAKIASKIKKPEGIIYLNQENLRTILWNLPIDYMYTIGKKTTEKLKAINIITIKDLVLSKNYYFLHKILGKRYYDIILCAQGKTVDKLPLTNHHKSLGQDITLEYDSNNQKYLEQKLHQIASKLAKKMQTLNIVTNVICFGYKVDHLKWNVKQTTLPFFTNDQTIIYNYAVALFNNIWIIKNKPIRAIRITLKKIIDNHEYSNLVPINLFCE